MRAGRDRDWTGLTQGVSDAAEPEEMDAEDILYILYTSGTTGKPKGIVHTTGGYLTGVTATARAVFDLKDSDIWWGGGRHRLGHRPLLHRLWPPGARRDPG